MISIPAQADNLCGVQCIPCPVQDRDLGEAPDVHQLDVWLLQDHDAASGRQANPYTHAHWVYSTSRRHTYYAQCVDHGIHGMDPCQWRR